MTDKDPSNQALMAMVAMFNSVIQGGATNHANQGGAAALPQPANMQDVVHHHIGTDPYLVAPGPTVAQQMQPASPSIFMSPSTLPRQTHSFGPPATQFAQWET